MSACVRLKVRYRTPAALIGEFTRSVGKGGVALESGRPLAVGTRFVFEMTAQGVSAPVEVLGEVVQCSPLTDGRHLVSVRYGPGERRAGIDEVLGLILETGRGDRARKHPRVPITLAATQAAAYSAAYAVRDLSRGGLAMEVLSEGLPKDVRVGEPFFCELTLGKATLNLHGEVAWVSAPSGGKDGWVSPTFGVRFGKLRKDTATRLEQILKLTALPPPPWHARVSFGLDAIERMP